MQLTKPGIFLQSERKGGGGHFWQKCQTTLRDNRFWRSTKDSVMMVPFGKYPLPSLRKILNKALTLTCLTLLAFYPGYDPSHHLFDTYESDARFLPLVTLTHDCKMTNYVTFATLLIPPFTCGAIRQVICIEPRDLKQHITLILYLKCGADWRL